MMRTRARRMLGMLGMLATVALVAGGSGCGSARPATGPQDADRQVRFGAQMANQGLWSEALFRFERADRLSPGNPKVLNNLAVAYEAAGRYEEALATYRRALAIAPGNADLRDNYARFVDFYESFRPPEPDGATTGGSP